MKQDLAGKVREHLRVHTQLLVKAIEWDEKGRREDVLLRGSDLKEADQWLLKAAGKQPSPTELQGEYVAASRMLMQATQQRERQQMLMRIVIGGLLPLLALSIGAGAIAEVNRRKAEDAIGEAETRRDIALGRQLTTQATALEKDSNWNDSQLLNIEAIKLLHKSNVNLSDAVQALNEQQDVSFWHSRFDAPERTRTSDDGQYVAKIGKGGVVRVWDIDTKEIKQFTPAPDGSLSIHRFSPNNRYLALKSESDAFLWDWKANKEIELPENIKSLDFSPNSRHLQLTLPEGKRLWKVTGEKVDLQFDNIESLEFSPNGRYAHVKSQTETVLWDMETQKTVDFESVDTIESLDFSPDDRYVRVNGKTDNLLWDLNTKKNIGWPFDDIEQWEFSPNSQHVAMLMASGQMVSRHIARPSKTYNSGGGNFEWIDFSPDSPYLLYVKDSQVRRLNVETITPNSFDIIDFPLKGVEEVLPLPTDQCAHPNNHYVGIYGKGEVKLWNIETDPETEEPRSLSIGQNRAEGLCFSADAQHVSIMFDDGTVGVWDIDTQQKRGHSFAASCYLSNCLGELKFSPNGDAIVTDKHVWDFSPSQPTIHPPENIKKIQLSPEHRYAMIHSETDVSVWDIEAQKSTSLSIDNAEAIAINDVSFSDDNRYMALNTASEGRLWDVEKQEFVKLAVDDINYLRVSPDSQFVALETNDSVEVWGLESQQEIRSWSGKKLPREQPTFSPNSRYLAVNEQPEQLGLTLMLWDIGNQKEVDLPVKNVESWSFSRDDHYVSFTTGSGEPVLWDTKKQTQVDLPIDNIEALAFRSGGDYLSIKSQDDELETLRNLEKHETVELPIENIEQILFDAGGHHYAILKNQSKTVLWNLKNKGYDDWTQEQLSINPTSQFKVSLDGQLLALQNEGVIVIWDMEKKIEIARTPPDRRFGEQGFGFSPENRFLISHNQNFLHVMLLDPNMLIDEACGRLTHNLTQKKWDQYFRDELGKKAKPYEKTCPDLHKPDGDEPDP